MMTKMEWPPQPTDESGEKIPLTIVGAGDEVLEVTHLTEAEEAKKREENKKKEFKGILGTGLEVKDYLLKINQEREEQGLPPLEEDEVPIVNDESEDGEELRENVG